MRTIDEITLDKVPPVDATTLGLVAIGSHVWGLNHAESDVDSMAITIESTKGLLQGMGKYQNTSIFKSETDHGWPIDIHVHEIGRAVEHLEKGNINFLTGVLSPIVAHEHPIFSRLRQLVLAQPTRQPYHSINGMCVGNMARYAGISRKTFSTDLFDYTGVHQMDAHRSRKILKGLEFGITWLETGKPAFCPPSRFEHSTKGIIEAMKEMDIAYANSTLPRSYAETDTPMLLRTELEHWRMLEYNGVV